MLVFNLMLTGTRPWLRHLRVNLLWFLKLAIFISNFSHRLRIKTPSFPYSDLILACRLLILFVLMCNQLYFSRTELIFEFWDKLLPVSNMASSRSKENVNLNYYTNWWCHSNGETCNIFWIYLDITKITKKYCRSHHYCDTTSWCNSWG